MTLFSFFSKQPKQPKPSRRTHLTLDALEERATPTANTISGYVYHDANNNGLRDSGETPIANVALQLKNNATNQVVATATSDATGFYQFANDSTVATAPTSLTKTVSFPDTDTNFDLTGVVDQFDPTFGVLNSIDVIHDGSITSSIQVENTSRTSGSTINGTVGGNLNLVAPGVNDVLTLTQNAGSLTVAKYDNTLDFGGASGGNLGTKTAAGNKTIALTGSALAAWQGTGTVTLEEIGTATSSAGGGGNVTAAVSSSGRSTITVRYNYTPTNGLQPGTYTISETQPSGYLDGQDAIAGVPIPNSIGADAIVVTLANTSLTNNNFGELKSASLAGYVYVDANNNGIEDAGEQGIGGVAITLTGLTSDGPVSQTATTDANGFYQFASLKPGTYGLQEGNPGSQYLDGKDTIGSQGGTAGNDSFTALALGSGVSGVNNNFGETLPAKLSGYVYVDANNNGIKESEPPIGGVTITLTGVTADGPVSQTATTDATGFYQFTGLKAGTYGLQEGNPGSQYLDGKDTIGSQGGTAGNDSFSSMTLSPGVNGINNNFGEILPAQLSGFVYVDANDNGVKENEQPIGGVTITLTGFTTDGPVSQTATTDATGFYQFANLKPGTYGLQEGNAGSQYLDGKDTIGSQGGTVGNDSFSSMTLTQGVNGINNNFGEIPPAKIAGAVYLDANANGVFDAGETGIPNTTVTLSGTDSLGPVARTATTDASGNYQFANLRPGTYSVAETQPTGYNDGQESVGTAGGAVANDLFSSIVLAVGASGEHYNFGELRADAADLGIVKIASASQANVGDTLTYTLTVTNYGADVAKDVSVVDTIPNGATLLNASGPSWAILTDTGKITATLPSLAVGLSTAITVQIRVPAVSNTIANTATVSSSTPDKNPTNNSSSVTTAVTLPAPQIAGLVATPTGVASKNDYLSSTYGQYLANGQNAAFVSALYQTLLNRVPEAAGQNYFLGLLQNGVSTAQVTSMIWASDEHRDVEAAQIYQAALGRAPNASELNSAAAALKAGVSEADVARPLYTSAEYLSLHPGTANLAGNLYVSVTGALPSATQSATALQAMDSSPLDQVVASIQQSDDALRNIVRAAYRAVLRREGTDSEISYWFGRLKFNGLSQGDLYQTFLNSSEFRTLANNAIKA